MPSGNGSSQKKAKPKAKMAAKLASKSNGDGKNAFQKFGDAARQDFNNLRGATSAQYRLGAKKDKKGNWS